MKILCVCTGNTCRSPMLMALLRAALAERGVAATVMSAGTGAGSGEPASAHAVTAMRERGLDLRAHRSRNVADADPAAADLVLALTPAHAARLRALGVPAARLRVVAAEAGGVPDPFGGSLDDYRATADVLAADAARLAADVAANMRRP
jgi:protein-tyrosine phosphatase